MNEIIKMKTVVVAVFFIQNSIPFYNCRIQSTENLNLEIYFTYVVEVSI